jgi:transposase InsO family protein
MSRDNRLWGTERIRGELLKLGIAVGNRSIRRYSCRGPERRSSQSWRAFLANHRPRIWAADLLTVQTLTFRTLHVLVFVAHGRRELVHFAVTAHPTAAWVWRQLINATPWGRAPAYLVRDCDAVYGAEFVRRAAGLGIRTLLTPMRAPRANAIDERLVGTLRRECLDHAIVVNERHLEALLSDFARYYNVDRPHRTLALETPQPAARPRRTDPRSPRAGRAAPRVRASRVGSVDVLPSDSRYRRGDSRPHVPARVRLVPTPERPARTIPASSSPRHHLPRLEGLGRRLRDGSVAVRPPVIGLRTGVEQWPSNAR